MIKSLRYVTMFLLMLAITVSARNQESRIISAMTGGPLVVKAVYVDSQGIKWFATNRGLCRYDNQTWRYFTQSEGLAGDLLLALTFEPSQQGDALWVATGGGVSRVFLSFGDVSGSESYTVEDGLLNDTVTDVALDSRNGKFFSSESGITWFHDGTVDSLTYEKYPTSMVNAPIRQLEMFNDTLYLAQEGGIGRFVSGVDGVTGATRWTSEYGMSPLSGNIQSVYVDEKGHQWFGTDEGLEEHAGHKAKENWSLYTTADGLVDNRVIAITEDTLGGGMWFGTLGGVSQLRDGVWTSYTMADGLLNDTVYDIGFDPDGSVWFATRTGVCRLQEGEFRDHYTSVAGKLAPGLEMNAVYNPAAEAILLSYRITEQVPVSTRLFGIDGVLLAQWDDLPRDPGTHRLQLPLSGLKSGTLPQGICIFQMIQGNRSTSGKLLLVR
jgi:hypothetical protein